MSILSPNTTLWEIDVPFHDSLYKSTKQNNKKPNLIIIESSKTYGQLNSFGQKVYKGQWHDPCNQVQGLFQDQGRRKELGTKVQ